MISTLTEEQVGWPVSGMLRQVGTVGDEDPANMRKMPPGESLTVGRSACAYGRAADARVRATAGAVE